MKHTLFFFISRGKKLFSVLYTDIFIALFYCSIVLPIVLRSNLQPDYAYRHYACKKNECIQFNNKLLFSVSGIPKMAATLQYFQKIGLSFRN